VRPLALPFEADAELLLKSGPAAAVLREAGAAGEALRPKLEAEVRAEMPERLRAHAFVALARVHR